MPIFLVARRRLGHPWLALLFGAAYLALPYVQGAALFEFHGFTLAAPLLAGAIAALEYRRPRLFARECGSSIARSKGKALAASPSR